MKTFRGVSEYRKGFGFLEFGENGVYWGNGRFAVKDDPNIARCLQELDVSGYEKRKRFRIGFMSGTRGCHGMMLFPSTFAAGVMESAVAPESNGGIPLSEIDLEGMVGLVAENGFGFVVDPNFHNYIMKAVNPDKVVARRVVASNEVTVPLAYMKDGKAAAILMPRTNGVTPGGEAPLEEVYDALFSQ